MLMIVLLAENHFIQQLCYCTCIIIIYLLIHSMPSSQLFPKRPPLLSPSHPDDLFHTPSCWSDTKEQPQPIEPAYPVQVPGCKPVSRTFKIRTPPRPSCTDFVLRQCVCNLRSYLSFLNSLAKTCSRICMLYRNCVVALWRVLTQ